MTLAAIGLDEITFTVLGVRAEWEVLVAHVERLCILAVALTGLWYCRRSHRVIRRHAEEAETRAARVADNTAQTAANADLTRFNAEQTKRSLGKLDDRVNGLGHADDVIQVIKEAAPVIAETTAAATGQVVEKLLHEQQDSGVNLGRGPVLKPKGV